MRELKIGESAITGYVGGVWDKDSKSFKIKRGMTKNDKKYQVFCVKVSSKDKDSGTYTNGKDIEVMLFGDVKIEDKSSIGLVGRFTPNNWTNSEGKEIRGNQFLAFEDGIFTPASWENKENTNSNSSQQAPKAVVAEEELPW